MGKNKAGVASGKLWFFVGGIVAIGVAVILFFTLISPALKALEIKSNGVLEIGAIYDVEKSGSEVNDEPLYYIEFVFIGEDGIEYTARSVRNYSIAKIRDMGFVTINYLENVYYVDVGREIEIYRIGNEAVMEIEDPLNFVNVLLAVGFGLVGLTLFCLGLLYAFGILGDEKVFKNGRNGEGTYVDKVVSVRVNGTPFYKVVFSFEDDDRQLQEVKFGRYREGETETLEGMRTFPIKYSGKKAVIDISKDELLRAQRDLAERRLTQQREEQAMRSQQNIDPFDQSNPYNQPDPFGGSANSDRIER